MLEFDLLGRLGVVMEEGEFDGFLEEAEQGFFLFARAADGFDGVAAKDAQHEGLATPAA